MRQLGKEVHYLYGALRVEVAGGLIGKNDRRVVHEGSRYRNALLLSARKLSRRVRVAAAKPDALQELQRAFPA